MALALCVLLKGFVLSSITINLFNVYLNKIKILKPSNLIWKKDNDEGLCIEYPSMALHAVSRDLVAFPHECIYIMLDKNIASKLLIPLYCKI